MIKKIKEKHVNLSIWIGIILIILGGVVFFWKELTLDFSGKFDSERVARYGDFIGGIVGSLWALGGMFLVYLGLKGQRIDIEQNRKALEAQIEEFKLQKLELAETRKIFEKQTKNLELQQFENSFFNLINLMRNQLDSIKHNKSSGITAFHIFESLLPTQDYAIHQNKKRYFQEGDYSRCIAFMNTFLIVLDLINKNNINTNYYFNILGSLVTPKALNMIAIYSSFTDYNKLFSESPFYNYITYGKEYFENIEQISHPPISTL